jgi:hypothetical protein
MAAASIQQHGSYQSSGVSTLQEEARRLYKRQRKGPLGCVWLVFALRAVLKSEVVEVWQEGFGTSSAMGFGRR